MNDTANVSTIRFQITEKTFFFGIFNLFANAQINDRSSYKNPVYNNPQNRFSNRKKPAFATFLQITDGSKSDFKKLYSKNYTKKNFSGKSWDKSKNKGKNKQRVYVAKKKKRGCGLLQF